jgi:hypothetical protein
MSKYLLVVLILTVSSAWAKEEIDLDQLIRERTFILPRENSLPFLDENYVTDITYEDPLCHFQWNLLLDVPSSGKFILVDLSTQRLWVFEDWKVIAHFIVSSGRRSLPTRPGNYTIGRKIPYAYSNAHLEEGLRKWWGMPYYMDINYLGSGFHGLPAQWGEFQETIDHLGSARSHGCVRLGHIPLDSLRGKSPAQWLFDWAEEGDNPFNPQGLRGTPVKIIGHYNFLNPVPEDRSSYRRFSREKGFYLEDPLLVK